MPTAHRPAEQQREQREPDHPDRDLHDERTATGTAGVVAVDDGRDDHADHDVVSHRLGARTTRRARPERTSRTARRPSTKVESTHRPVDVADPRARRSYRHDHDSPANLALAGACRRAARHGARARARGRRQPAYYHRDVRWLGIEPKQAGPGQHPRRRRPARACGPRCCPAAAEDLELADASVDAVVCSFVLCSVADQTAALASAAPGAAARRAVRVRRARRRARRHLGAAGQNLLAGLTAGRRALPAKPGDRAGHRRVPASPSSTCTDST